MMKEEKVNSDFRDAVSHTQRVVELTADGSSTLFVPALEEHYHSVKGALTESQHIFINMGLSYSKEESPCILEIGFGTGLNAYLTLLESQNKHQKIYYCGIELYPLSWETICRLNYSTDPLLKTLHSSDWGREVEITPNFILQKEQKDFTSPSFSLSAFTKDCFDVIYFDAFSPDKQPEMWNTQLFEHLYVSMNKGAILVTYCAKGEVRRMLQSVGFVVERLPGPPGGKREILRATKL